MAGNCSFGALVRFGGGDLRSMVVVVVMGIFAFVTLSGPLAPLRIWAFPQLEASVPQGIAHWLSGRTGLPPLAFALPVAGLMLIWALTYAPLRRDRRRLIWGAAAGLAILWCLVATTQLMRDSFGAVTVEAPSFTAPLGRTLLYFMTSTAGGITFSVGLVAGVLAGSFLGSAIRGLFQWEACDDPRELGRQVWGAALMGIGGTIALGCSVGQDMSAMRPVLAFSAPVTLAAIVVGAFGPAPHDPRLRAPLSRQGPARAGPPCPRLPPCQRPPLRATAQTPRCKTLPEGRTFVSALVRRAHARSARDQVAKIR
ncbi:MAG: YeeE/YedE family protein [Paracoccaceae bacterium]